MKNKPKKKKYVISRILTPNAATSVHCVKSGNFSVVIVNRGLEIQEFNSFRI